MPDKITVSTFQLFEMFPDQESARKYLESRLWPNGVRGSPPCNSRKRLGLLRNPLSSFQFLQPIEFYHPDFGLVQHQERPSVR